MAVNIPPHSYIDRHPRGIQSTQRGMDYYIALVVVLMIWAITPISCVYLIAFPVVVSRLSGTSRLAASTFAFYALAESVFAVFYLYRARQAQAQPPSMGLPAMGRTALFHTILHLGTSASTGRAGSAPHDLGVVPAMPATQVKEMVSVGTACNPQAVLEKATISAATGRNHGRDDCGPSPRFTTPMESSSSDSDFTKVEHNCSTQEDAHKMEFRERLRPWFNHVPWESLRRENVLVWLSWACLNLSLPEARKQDHYVESLNETLRKLEARTGTDIPAGYDPSISVCRPTLDPVVVIGRPLLLYLLPTCINAVLRYIVYPSWGLQMHVHGEIEYLVRIPPGWVQCETEGGPDRLPVLYIQGLGFGLISNYSLVKRLIRNIGDQPLLIPLSPHTSQSVFHRRHLRPPTRSDFVKGITEICYKWNLWHGATSQEPARGGVSVLSHSNGSVAHCWILKDNPNLIKRNTFVDPVVFCSWEGDITHSFCYRRPTTALQLLMLYLIASEVGVAHYIRRHFDWTHNTLFFDEIPDALDPQRTAFFLAGKDMIIDAARTRKYLESHDLEAQSLHWDPNGNHGDALKGDSGDTVLKFVGSGSS